MATYKYDGKQWIGYNEYDTALEIVQKSKNNILYLDSLHNTGMVEEELQQIRNQLNEVRTELSSLEMRTDSIEETLPSKQDELSAGLAIGIYGTTIAVKLQDIATKLDSVPTGAAITASNADLIRVENILYYKTETSVGGMITYAYEELTNSELTERIVAQIPTDFKIDDTGRLVLVHDSNVIGAGVEIGGIGVTIDAPATATQGTLTATQLGILEASETNYIMFNHEKYYLMDKQHTSGSLTYSHIGADNQINHIKTFTITLSNLTWLLIDTEVGKSDPAITIVDELPTANEENFEKGKIYTTGELLQYISKVGDIGTLKAENIGALAYATFSTAAAVGNKIYYVSGGQNASMSNKIIVYDIETQTSETLATTMPQPAIYRQAISVGKNIYIFGGTTSWDNLGQSANISSIYKLDTSNNSISVVGSLPKALFMSYIGCVDKNIYIFGGCMSANSNFGAKTYYSASIYKFNTENNEVTTLAVSLPTEIANGACVSKDKKIYIIGGQKTNSYTYYNYIYVFDAETETISSLSIDVGNMYGGTAQIIGNKIYIMGSSLKEINLEDNSIVTLTLDNYISGVGRPSVLIGNNIYNLSGGAGINNINSSILKFFIDFSTFKYSFKTIATQ